jgi:hypothetical protein
MNCLQCATNGRSTSAVAVCADCGAGVCLEHARIVALTAQPVGLIPAHASGRQIRCTACPNAEAGAPAHRVAAPLREREPALSARG